MPQVMFKVIYSINSFNPDDSSVGVGNIIPVLKMRNQGSQAQRGNILVTWFLGCI